MRSCDNLYATNRMRQLKAKARCKSGRRWRTGKQRSCAPQVRLGNSQLAGAINSKSLPQQVSTSEARMRMGTYPQAYVAYVGVAV